MADNAESMKALDRFEEDIQCLDLLKDWFSKFNIFDILRISKAEIRHSNVLAWLLNPNENHGFGDIVLREFINHVRHFYKDTEMDNDIPEDLHDMVVLREWEHTDILAVSRRQRFLICIENKIETGEHDDQLHRYFDTVNSYYYANKGYRKYFIYLTPDGDEPSDINWHPLSYKTILEILEKTKDKVSLKPDVDLLISNYIEILRREIVSDKELAQRCWEIYNAHSVALDLIFSHLPNRLENLNIIMKEWLAKMNSEEKLIYKSEYDTITALRFRTRGMTEIIPDLSGLESYWKTNSIYSYEIRIISDKNKPDEKKIVFQFVVHKKNITKDLLEICENINSVRKHPLKKENWTSRTLFSYAQPLENKVMNKNIIFSMLNRGFEKLMDYEKELKETLDKKGLKYGRF